MDNYMCYKCMWEGTEDEVGAIYESNRHNPQDHTLYEEKSCPDCHTTEQLVNIDEERRYENRAHAAWAQKEIRDGI